MPEDRQRDRVGEKEKVEGPGGVLVGDSTFIAGKRDTFMALRFPRQGESPGSEAGSIINIGMFCSVRRKEAEKSDCCIRGKF